MKVPIFVFGNNFRPLKNKALLTIKNVAVFLQYMLYIFHIIRKFYLRSKILRKILVDFCMK